MSKDSKRIMAERQKNAEAEREKITHKGVPIVHEPSMSDDDALVANNRSWFPEPAEDQVEPKRKMVEAAKKITSKRHVMPPFANPDAGRNDTSLIDHFVKKNSPPREFMSTPADAPNAFYETIQDAKETNMEKVQQGREEGGSPPDEDGVKEVDSVRPGDSHKDAD